MSRRKPPHIPRPTGSAVDGHPPDQQTGADVRDQCDDQQHEGDLGEGRDGEPGPVGQRAVELGSRSWRRWWRRSEKIECGVEPSITPLIIATAIVSPSARPSPSIEAPITPARTHGKVTARIASESVIPSASAPSIVARGTCRRRSRVVAAMIGMTMIASTIAEGSSPSPVAGRAAKEAEDRYVRDVARNSGKVRCEEGTEGEHTPQPVDDTGDAGQHLEAEADPARQAWR